MLLPMEKGAHLLMVEEILVSVAIAATVLCPSVDTKFLLSSSSSLYLYP